ncbi:MAG: helix-turn-helix domain-containing protein [Planctomycetes bacterium]|nr:helix-turn-helix domain-containing protein [Planctomycetota bacterium]
MTGPRPPEPTKEILNIDEAALFLGVSTKTFAKVLRDGEMPGRKIGREWKFSRRALIDWVASGHSRDFVENEDKGEESEEAAGGTPAERDGRRARPVRPARRSDSEMSVEED